MAQLNQLIRRFNEQADQIQLDGYVLQGSVVKRYFRRSVRGVSKAYGPYYVWTRKINNKTVTEALTAERARIIKDAIQRNRRIEQRLMRLRTLSEEIINTITTSVAKRNRL